MVQVGLYVHHYRISLISFATYGLNLAIYSLTISAPNIYVISVLLATL